MLPPMPHSFDEHSNLEHSKQVKEVTMDLIDQI
jgi:hypothetical protein